MDNVTVKLRKAVPNMKGEEVSEVSLKPITAAMLLKYGELMRTEIRTNGNAETVFVETNMDALRGYIVGCTELPEPIVYQMHPADILKLKDVIEGFFQDFR